MGELRHCPLGHQWEAVLGDSRFPDDAAYCPVCSDQYENPPLPPASDPAVAALGEFISRGVPAASTRVGGAAPTTFAGDATAGPPDRRWPVVEGYQLVAELGHGGMGIVYKAWQISLKRYVALKMVLAGPRAGAETLARFRTEAEAAARLQHPHIVQIHDIGEHDGLPYLAMEFVDGGSLDRRLRDGALTPRAAAGLIEKLARATHAAHSAGVVHRDLKPANVLLTADGWPKIADFGLAKQLDRRPAEHPETRTGAILGTPGYMAPEQAAGTRAAVGPAADVYALGAILYELLTGRPPFRGADVLQTLEQVRTQEPLSPARLQPGLPRDLVTVSLKCLEKSPARRYATALDLAEDLCRFQAGIPIVARPARLTDRLVKWVRRHPSRAALIALTLLAAAGFAGFRAWHDREFAKESRRAEVSEAEVRAQRLRNLASFQKSRATLGGLLNRMEEDVERAADRRTTSLQHEVEEAALRYYADALKDFDGPDPESRFTRAQVLTYAAEAHRLLGQVREGLADLRHAREELERLEREFPENDAYRAELADCLYHEGELEIPQGPPGAAERSFHEALALDDRDPGTDPDRTRSLRNRGYCRWRLCGVYELAGQLPRAVESAAAAADAWTRLLDAEPTNAFYRSRTGMVLKEQARLLHACNRTAQTEAAARRAVAVLSPMLDPLPRDLESLWGPVWLAEAYREWALILVPDAARRREAIDKYTAGIGILDKVLQREPQFLRGRVIQSQLYTYRATLHEDLGDAAEAISDREQSCVYADGRHRAICRADFALVAARLGDYRRALAEAHVAASSPELDPLWRLAVVRACSLAIAAVERDSDATAEYRGRVCGQCARLALLQLQACQGAGFFKDERWRTEVLTVAALEPLRKRPEVQKLLGRLKPPAK